MHDLKNKKSDTLTKYNLKELLAESVREEGCVEDIVQFRVKRPFVTLKITDLLKMNLTLNQSF